MNEVDKSRALDVDYLKSFGVDPQWFGLGFIQLKLTDTQRMHFWHPELSADVPEEELHDHRYNFTSEVLRGELTNEIWIYRQYQGFGPYGLYSVACTPDDTEPTYMLGTGNVQLMATHHLRQGNRYKMIADTLHRLRATHAVTLLTRGGILSSRATVVRTVGADSVCPFERKIHVDDLWKYIRECCVGFPSGYHDWDIPKGQLGAPSKIIEEALECADALNSSNPIMASLELSDVYGALEACVEKHFPHLTMDDLKVMAARTRGAFERGERSSGTLEHKERA